jgi:hypothetical protein
LSYVSCAPETAYRDGGFYEGGGRLESLCATYRGLTDRLELLGEVFAPFSCHRPVSRRATARDAAFLEKLRSSQECTDSVFRHGAAALLVRINDCAINSDVIYLPSGDACPILWETHRPNDRTAVPVFSPDDLLGPRARSDLPPHRCGGALYFYIGSAGSKNYGHWLVDDFPRLEGLRKIAQRDDRRVVIVMTSWGDAIDRVRAESVRHALDDHAELLWLTPRRTYRFEELHYVTPISFHPALKCPTALNLAADVVTNRLARTGASARQIFVKRGAANTRCLVNDAAIEAVLSRLGFVSIEVESMDFANQASAFYNADMVVGVMGAAMTNTMFCRPETRIVHLAPQDWLEPFYWDLATVRKHAYAACFGPGQLELPPEHRPFVIDPALLIDLLEGVSVPA